MKLALFICHSFLENIYNVHLMFRVNFLNNLMTVKYYYHQTIGLIRLGHYYMSFFPSFLFSP